MIVLKSLLSRLSRPDVAEVVLQSGTPPAVRVNGELEPVSERPIVPDDLVQLLFNAGGSRYVESLGAKPTQWRTRVEGVGPVVVSATQHGDAIQARFSRSEPAAAATPAKPAKGPKSARAGRVDTPSPSSRRSNASPGSRRRGSRAAALASEPRRKDELEADTPPPAPVRRGEMPALLGDMAIELGISASEIPTVPLPLIDDGGPISPRTLPEAQFSRDAPPAPFRKVPSEPPPPAPVAGEVAALSEPFAALARSLDPPAPPAHRSQAGRITRPFARDPHTPAFRKLLRAAREAGASDLHLVAGRPPLIRVAGQVIAKGEPLDPLIVEDMMLSRIPSRLAAPFERDGSCDFAIEDPELGRVRVNVSKQRTGIKASMRLVAAEVPTLASLGLPEAIAGVTRHHQGLIVITGPTGHGKTTTMAAIVDILNRETTRHIITVEDPIEYLHPRRTAMMSQREVGTHTRSFQSALKASLREDPDVIVVGELRDTETVRMALAASETGHLVLGTMSTPSAAKTIDRLIDLFPPGDQQQVRMTLAGGLRMIVSQRLLPDVEGKRMVAAAEVLPGMVPLWNLIRDGRTYQIPSLQQRGKGLGVIRLDDSLLELVRAGRVTAAAAIAAADAPDEVEAALGVRRPSQPPPAAPPPGRGTSPLRPPDLKAPDGANKGGFFERAGALFGGKKGT